MTDQPADVVRAHPVKLRRVAIGIAAAVVVAFVAIALLLRGSSEGVLFGVGDQIAMVALGLFVAGGVLMIARPAVTADVDGLHVRNIVVSHDVPWEVVREVSFRDGSPWAVLELADDDQLALLAVQASDGDRAVTAVRGLRALHARNTARHSGGASDAGDPPAPTRADEVT